MTITNGGPPSLTIGQAVGQAEASLTRLLTGVLAERRTEITIRTLREITTRARGIPVRRTTTEESS